MLTEETEVHLFRQEQLHALHGLLCGVSNCKKGGLSFWQKHSNMRHLFVLCRVVAHIQRVTPCSIRFLCKMKFFWKAEIIKLGSKKSTLPPLVLEPFLLFEKPSPDNKC